MVNDPRDQLAVLRLSGEVSIKAKATRRQFVSRLTRNVKDALVSAGAAPHIHRSHDRLFVELPGAGADAARSALSRVFGLQSLSLAVRVPANRLEEVVEAGTRLFREHVRGRRFCRAGAAGR